jgi:hypothetical protein
MRSQQQLALAHQAQQLAGLLRGGRMEAGVRLHGREQRLQARHQLQRQAGDVPEGSAAEQEPHDDVPACAALPAAARPAQRQHAAALALHCEPVGGARQPAQQEMSARLALA